MYKLPKNTPTRIGTMMLIHHDVNPGGAPDTNLDPDHDANRDTNLDPHYQKIP